jgi:hypothetical protein
MQPGTQLAMAVLYHLGLDRRANYSSVLDVVQRAAAQAPRPGRWIEAGHVIVESDGRIIYDASPGRFSQADRFGSYNYEQLNQAETDKLIAVELHNALLLAQARWAVVEGLVPWPLGVTVRTPFAAARAQRGGLHSDPRIRAVALALWGDRDVGIPRAEYERRRAS